MKLVLVRHGATEWSVDGRHTGRTDVPLTPAGQGQARATAGAVRRLLGGDFAGAEVWSSPLERARHTARIVVGTHREVHVSDDLAEFDYGAYEGLTTVQIRAVRPDWDLWRDGCPRGETPDVVAARADRFLAAVDGRAEPVLVVAHAHLLRILAARAIGLAPAAGRWLALDTATVSVIDDGRDGREIRLWNLDPGLIA